MGSYDFQDRPHGPDLLDVLAFVWRRRMALLVGGLLGAGVAGLFLLLAIPQYQAVTIVGPAADLSASGFSALAEGLEVSSPLVSMRGQGGESADFVRFERTLTGPAVAQTLFQDPKVRAGLGRVARLRFLPATPPASPEALSAVLSRAVSIEPIGLTSLRRIVYAHPDPAFALYLSGLLHRTADARIRVDAKLRSAKRIAFLESRMEKIRHPDQLRALASLLTEQEQISMMAAMDEPYAAAVIEPPSVGPRPSWPPRALVLAVFILLGASFGVLWSCARRLPAPARRSYPAALQQHDAQPAPSSSDRA